MLPMRWLQCLLDGISMLTVRRPWGLKIGKIEKGPLGSETKHLLVIHVFETVS